jgi:selenide,water dikinase
VPPVVLTTDFPTPVVDDTHTFGRIAAANALSDVYAMGGTPVAAVNLLGCPRDVLPAELAPGVPRGGLEVGQKAGCHVGGGHSIDDPEPKNGMAVTGLVDIDRIITNSGAWPAPRSRSASRWTSAC